MLIITALLLLAAAFLLLSYQGRRHRAADIIRQNTATLLRSLRQTGLTLWTYDITTGLYGWIDDDNRYSTFTPEDFARRYRQEVHQHINQLMQQLIRGDAQERVFDFMVKRHDDNKRRYTLLLTVMRRNRKGEAQLIVATQRDVTSLHQGNETDRDTTLRYQSIFNTAMADMVYYNSKGEISEMNQRAQETFQIDIEMARAQGVSTRMALLDDSIDPLHFEPFHASQFRGKQRYEIQLLPIYNSRGRLECAYGSGRDVTEIAENYNRLRQSINSLQRANKALTDYVRNIDYALKVGGISIANYTPENHILTVYSEINRAQLTLTRQRIEQLLDRQTEKATLRMLEDMEQRSNASFDCQIKTKLRQQDGSTLFLHAIFMPITDDNGRVEYYFGMLRDISELKRMERQLASETVKARQLEASKNAFMRNMSYEIRTPLNVVVGFAELFRQPHSQDDEKIYVREMKDNAARLLQLINGILQLSRLDAGMIETKKSTVNFPDIFKRFCQDGWEELQRPTVEYIVEESYAKLELEIDVTNIGNIVSQLCNNAAKFTDEGHVKASYNYSDGLLTITIEDTGCGIADEQKGNIFERFSSNNGDSPGLGLPICREMAKLMGGTITINSQQGEGTTATLTIPCSAVNIEPRKEDKA